MTENIPRILRSGLVAKVNLLSWKFPKVFKWLQEKGEISQADMLRIFNCGIGMVCIIDHTDLAKAQKVYRIISCVRSKLAQLLKVT